MWKTFFVIEHRFHFSGEAEFSQGSSDSLGRRCSFPDPSGSGRNRCCRFDTESDGGACAYLFKARRHCFVLWLWAVTLFVTYRCQCNWCSEDRWITWPTRRAVFSSSLQSFCSSGTRLTQSTTRRAVGGKEHCRVRGSSSCAEQNTIIQIAFRVHTRSHGSTWWWTASVYQAALCNSSWS